MCSGEWLVALVKLRAMDSAPAETEQSANKFGAFSDRAPSYGRPAQFLMFERPSVSVVFLLSRLSSFHRRMMRTRVGSRHQKRIHRHRRRLARWQVLCLSLCRSSPSFYCDRSRIIGDAQHPMQCRSPLLPAQSANAQPLRVWSNQSPQLRSCLRCCSKCVRFSHRPRRIPDCPRAESSQSPLRISHQLRLRNFRCD